MASHKASRKPSSKKKKRSNDEGAEIPPEAILITLVAFAIVLVWQWAQNNPLLFWGIVVIILAGAGFALYKFPGLRPKFLSKAVQTLKPKSQDGSEETEDELAPIVRAIEQAKLEVGRSEEDFEKQLYQWLNAKDFKTKRQVSDKTRSPVDLVIDNRVAVEIKIAESLTHVRTLVGQVLDDIDYYEKVVAVIIDYGRLQGIDEYAKKIEKINPGNTAVVVLEADVKRRKRKDKYFQVRQSTTY